MTRKLWSFNILWSNFDLQMKKCGEHKLIG